MSNNVSVWVNQMFFTLVTEPGIICACAGCGGELSGPRGSFNSPDYPNRYPENRECIWYITTTAGSSITITIHEFDVEYHQDCNYDVLEVSHRPERDLDLMEFPSLKGP